jgi:DNA-binding NarL/FixJ family response regulator
VTIRDFIVAGKTGKQIAALLQISEKTVEFHKTALFRALGVHSSFELIRFAQTDALTGTALDRAGAGSPGR